MLHMASRSLQHWLNVGVSQNWLSFSHFPREAKQMKCGEKIVDGQFLPFHPRSVYLAFGHHSNNSCLACLIVQFDGTAWLKAGLCHKYTFYYMDLMLPKKIMLVFWTSSRFIWKFQGQLPGLNGSSTDLIWCFIWETSQILFVRHFDDENNDICCVIEQSNM